MRQNVLSSDIALLHILVIGFATGRMPRGRLRCNISYSVVGGYAPCLINKFRIFGVYYAKCLAYHEQSGRWSMYVYIRAPNQLASFSSGKAPAMRTSASLLIA